MQGKRCGRDRLASTPGEIHNPDKNGDYKYDHNSDCVWTITAEFDKVIEIEFYYMDLEESSPCEADYVQVKCVMIIL